MFTSCFPPPGQTPQFTKLHGSSLLIVITTLIGLSMGGGCAYTHTLTADTPTGEVTTTRDGVVPFVRRSHTKIETKTAYAECLERFGQPSRGNPAWQWMLDEQAKQWAWRCRDDAKGLAANPAGSNLGYTSGGGYGYPGMMPGMMGGPMGGQFLAGGPPLGYYSGAYGALAIDPAGQPWNAQAIVNEDMARSVAKTQGYGYGSPLQVVISGKSDGATNKEDAEFKAAMAKQLREQQEAIEALKAAKAKADDDGDDDKK